MTKKQENPPWIDIYIYIFLLPWNPREPVSTHGKRHGFFRIEVLAVEGMAEKFVFHAVHMQLLGRSFFSSRMTGCVVNRCIFSNEKRAPGWLGYIGDYTTHLCGDYHIPL